MLCDRRDTWSEKATKPRPFLLVLTVVPFFLSPFRFGSLRGSDGLSAESTTLSRAQVRLLTTDNRLRLLDDLLTLGKDKLDVARVRHVGVDLGNC